MDFMNLAAARRSIRQYEQKDVDDALLRELIDAARIALSAHNRQPWRFMIVRGAAKEHIAETMEAWIAENRDTAPRYARTSKYTARVVRQAPVLILVFQQQDGLCQTGDTLSIGAALEHMCLRAQELGLGALWILDTCYTQEDICRYVGSGELELCCALCVGLCCRSARGKTQNGAFRADGVGRRQCGCGPRKGNSLKGWLKHAIRRSD